MSTEAERITALEVKASMMQSDLHEIKASQALMQTSQAQMLAELQRYRGFVGGIMLTIGAVWAFIQLVVPMVAGLFPNRGG